MQSKTSRSRSTAAARAAAGARTVELTQRSGRHLAHAAQACVQGHAAAPPGRSARAAAAEARTAVSAASAAAGGRSAAAVARVRASMPDAAKSPNFAAILPSPERPPPATGLGAAGGGAREGSLVGGATHTHRRAVSLFRAVCVVVAVLMRSNEGDDLGGGTHWKARWEGGERQSPQRASTQRGPSCAPRAEGGIGEESV